MFFLRLGRENNRACAELPAPCASGPCEKVIGARLFPVDMCGVDILGARVFPVDTLLLNRASTGRRIHTSVIWKKSLGSARARFYTEIGYLL